MMIPSLFATESRSTIAHRAGATWLSDIAVILSETQPGEEVHSRLTLGSDCSNAL